MYYKWMFLVLINICVLELIHLVFLWTFFDSLKYFTKSLNVWSFFNNKTCYFEAILKIIFIQFNFSVFNKKLAVNDDFVV